MERAGAWRHPGGPLLGKHKRKAHWFIASDDPYPWPDGERPPRHAWYVRHLDVLFTPPPDSCSLKQLVEQIERALAREPYPPQEAQNAC